MQLRQLLLTPDPSTKRLVWVDNAKAALIVLVVIGHFAALAGPLKTIVYAFHLPAFLFLTGFMLSANLGKMSPVDFLRKYIFPYIRLYLFMSAASIAFWWLIKFHSSEGLYMTPTAITQSLYGTQTATSRFWHDNGPLWYLPFLVSSFLLLYAVARLPLLLQALAIAAFYIFTTHYEGPRLLWAIDAAGVGLIFIALGQAFRKSLNGRVGNLNLAPWMLPALILLSTIGLVAAAYINGGSNINVMWFGKNAIVYLVAAILGTIAVSGICILTPQTRLANLLSTHSLVIFCIHIYAVKSMRGFLGGLPALERLALVVSIGFLIAVACALIAIVLTPWLDRYVLLRGKPKSLPQPSVSTRSASTP